MCIRDMCHQRKDFAAHIRHHVVAMLLKQLKSMDYGVEAD